MGARENVCRSTTVPRWSTADCSHANCAVPHTHSHTHMHTRTRSLTQTSTWQSACRLHVSRDELLIQLGPKHRDDPVRVTRERTDWVSAPPRLASIIRGHQLLDPAYTVPPIRHAEKLQPGSALFLPHPCSFWLTTFTHCIVHVGSTARLTRNEDEDEDLQTLGRDMQEAGPKAQTNTAGLSVRGQSHLAKRPQADLSQNTHGLGCYMPPPSCPSTSAASPPAADHHSPWRLSPYAVFPSLLCACSDTMAFHPLLILPFEPDGLAGWLLSRLQLG